MAENQEDIKTPQPEVVPEQRPEQQPVRVWAEKAGHLPEMLAGTKLKPVRNNRKAWLARAACARLNVTLDDLIDERTYLEAVATVAAADAR